MSSPSSPALAAIPTYRLTDLLFQFGMEYYTSGRQAVMNGLMFASGPLFHHAVEYILKSKLAETEPYERFKRDYSHNLPKMWDSFKGKVGGDLSRFDGLIAELQRFENIRYPEEILLHGALLFGGFGEGRSTGTLPGRQYHLTVGSVDALVAVAFRLCNRNPVCYMPMKESARDAIRFLNDHCAEWFSGPAAGPPPEAGTK